jgi:hypothetical protein
MHYQITTNPDILDRVLSAIRFALVLWALYLFTLALLGSFADPDGF